MRTKYIAVIFFAILLTAFFSCENQDEMGHGIIPQADYAAVTVTDTIEVEAFTEYDDTLYAAYKNYMTAGIILDPVFGKTETSFAIKFSNTSYGKYKEGAMADSVILSIGLDTTQQRFYGDSISKFKLQVFPVVKVMEQKDRFYQNTDFEEYYDKTPIGEAEFSPAEIKNRLSIKLDKSYGDKIIKATADTTFDEKICGLYFKADDNNSNSVIRFYYNSRTSDFNYNVYYHTEGETTSSYVLYSLSATDININFAKHDYTGTELENIDTVNQAEQVYLQGLTGTKIRVQFPNVKALQPTDGSYFSLIRAQLIVPLADTSISHEKEFQAIPRIYCTGKTSNNTDLYFNEFYDIDRYGNKSYHGFGITNEHNYSINMTGRIQNLLNLYAAGKEPTYKIYLYPSNRVSDFTRSVINTPVNKENPMRLVVEYLKYER
jgi:hypothetical protein